MTTAELTEYLHREVPLTAAMDLRVLKSADDEVQIAAPLSANRNLHGTAFGGSLAALGMVTGWALLHLAMRRASLSAQLVIQRSEIDYVAPVAGDFFASSRLSKDAWPAFVAALQKRGRGRITVQTEIRAAASAHAAPVAALHRGRYVAVARA